jgi:hypothetical protein
MPDRTLEDIIKEVEELKKRLDWLEELVNIIGERVEDLSHTTDGLRAHTGYWKRDTEYEY